MRAFLNRIYANFLRLKHRKFLKIFIDLCLIACAYYVAFLLRFEGLIPVRESQTMFMSMPFVLMIFLVLMILFGLYRGVWIYSSIRDLAIIGAAATLGVLLTFLIFDVGQVGFIPRSILIIFWMLVGLGCGGVRLAHRVFYNTMRQIGKRFKHVLVVGAGNAGEMIIRQIVNEPELGYRAVAIVDDRAGRQGARIHGIPVVGMVEDIPQVARSRQVEEIIIATPSATAAEMRRIVDYCERAGVTIKTLPGPRELVNGQVSLNKIRKVKIEDLLEREPIRTDLEGISRLITGKTVMVTGAAGSIGSELCRQLLKLDPALLIMLDRSESSLYFLDHELKHTMNGRASRYLIKIADITNQQKMNTICARYRPSVVFHAAAYKHVPLMEAFPEEAVINNVFGTISVASAAARNGVEKFIMISTDKAVNPTSVMGASKRLAELYCMREHKTSKMKHIVVRFGNVLASQGSVVPLFQKQIETGGPLTVTHPDITRYFMTIPEAVQLILQASMMGQGGEIFILDMGEPIRIYDMARHLISLTGLELGKDIEIKTIGLRPGEKLYEELWNEDEEPLSTDHEKILKSRNCSVNGSAAEALFQQLRHFADQGDRDKIIGMLQKMVPTFEPMNGKSSLKAEAIVNEMRVVARGE